MAKILPNVIVAAGPEENTYDTVVISKALIPCLHVRNCASLLLSKNTKGYVSISGLQSGEVAYENVRHSLRYETSRWRWSG